MKKSKLKLTVIVVMIVVMSLALFSAAYAAIYKPEFLQSIVNTTINDEKDNEIGKLTLDDSTTNALPILDQVSLAKFNGKNGQPSYVAFEGVVYEVSKFTSWVGGFHNGYEAGKDLTEAFKNSPHTRSIFDDATVVGTYSTTIIPPTATTQQTVLVPGTASQPTQAPTTGNVTNFTTQTLNSYNGQAGKPAYIAVNGVVYDVTSYWSSGQHKGLPAGTDVTTAFAGSPHSQSLLNSLPVVGSLALDQQILVPSITTKVVDNAYDDDNEDEDDD